MQRRDAGLKAAATKANRNATARCRAEARRYEGKTLLVSDDEESAVVLGVDLAVGADGDGGVGGADGGVEEHLSGGDGEDSGIGLGQFVNVTVLAVDVDVAEHVDGGHVDAPFVAVGMIGIDGGALELPFDIETRVELGDVIRAVGRRRADRAGSVAIGCGGVMVVFNYDGESVVVNPDSGRGVPAEIVGTDIISQRVEAEKMAAREIVIIERAEHDGSVG